ncbi:unnamed protein product [Rotaria sp. Silwood2]|nr:unnamed protein product [Rotaria sp. Silwood2]
MAVHEICERRLESKALIDALRYHPEILCIINLVILIYSVITKNEDNISSRIKSSIPLFVLTIYYTFGLLVVYKYYRIGVLVFAWIGALLFVAASLFIGWIFFVIMILIAHYNRMSIVFEFLLKFGLTFGLFAGIVILTLKLAFNLAKSIKMIGYTNV